MKLVAEFIAIAEFLGDDMTDEQAERLMDEARADLSIADMALLLDKLPGGAFYTQLSMYSGEMGGLHWY